MGQEVGRNADPAGDGDGRGRQRRQAHDAADHSLDHRRTRRCRWRRSRRRWSARRSAPRRPRQVVAALEDVVSPKGTAKGAAVRGSTCGGQDRHRAKSVGTQGGYLVGQIRRVVHRVLPGGESRTARARDARRRPHEAGRELRRVGRRAHFCQHRRKGDAALPHGARPDHPRRRPAPNRTRAATADHD